MEQNHHTEISFRRYLLGWLGQEEQETLEKRLLTDDEYFEELLMAEDELVDDYISGALSESERERFEQHFLAAAERQQKLGFARALNKYVTVDRLKPSSPATARRQSDSFWRRFVPASLHAQKPLLGVSLAALLIIICGVSWLVVKNMRLQNQSGQGASAAVALSLSPGLTRGAGEIKKLAITADTSTVELRLELIRDEYQLYRAIVQTDEGKEVFTADKLTPETVATRRAVIVNLPARLLSSGDHRVKLSGIAANGVSEDVDTYYFRVTVNALQSQ
jgi:hypothetical protein